MDGSLVEEAGQRRAVKVQVLLLWIGRSGMQCRFEHDFELLDTCVDEIDG